MACIISHRRKTIAAVLLSLVLFVVVSDTRFGWWESGLLLRRGAGNGYNSNAGGAALIYIDYQTRLYVGLGNRVKGLVGVLAIARAFGRSVSVSGPYVIWKDFWLASFEYDRKIPEKTMVCTLAAFRNISSECYHALAYEPTVPIHLLVTEGHGALFGAAYNAAIPGFRDRYLEAAATVFGVQTHQLPKDMTEILFLLEAPRVFDRPTRKFQHVIDQFLSSHNLVVNQTSDGYHVDLSLQVRLCADCSSWNMTKDRVQNDVLCAFQHYQESAGKPWNETKLFLTSDSRITVSWIEEILPPGATLIEHIPEKLIQTAFLASNKRNFETLALPYLDNWLLGTSRYVGTCYTTFPQVGVHRHAPDLQRLDNIIVWFHEYREPHFTDRYCRTLSNISF